MPKAQYWAEFDQYKSAIQFMGWVSDTGDSANYSEYLAMTRNSETGRGQYNCGHYSSTELDQLITQANTEMDMERRNELLKKVISIEDNDVAFILLHWQNLSWGVNKKITNLQDNVNLKNFPLFGDGIIDESK